MVDQVPSELGNKRVIHLYSIMTLYAYTVPLTAKMTNVEKIAISLRRSNVLGVQVLKW
jgi:hypothetical protein